MTEDQIKLIVLNLLEKLMDGAEKSVPDPDDWSGCNTEWILNSERFRQNIQEELKSLPPTPDGQDE